MAEKRPAEDDAEGAPAGERARTVAPLLALLHTQLPVHVEFPAMLWDSTSRDKVQKILHMAFHSVNASRILQLIIELLIKLPIGIRNSPRLRRGEVIEFLNADAHVCRVLRIPRDEHTGCTSMMPLDTRASGSVSDHIAHIMRHNTFAAALMMKYWIYTQTRVSAGEVHHLFRALPPDQIANGARTLHLFQHTSMNGSPRGDKLVADALFTIAPALPLEMVNVALYNTMMSDLYGRTITPGLASWSMTIWCNGWMCPNAFHLRNLMSHHDAKAVVQCIRTTWTRPRHYYPHTIPGIAHAAIMHEKERFVNLYQCGPILWEYVCISVARTIYNKRDGWWDDYPLDHTTMYRHMENFNKRSDWESMATCVQDARMCLQWDTDGNNNGHLLQAAMAIHANTILTTPGGRALFKVVPWPMQLEVLKSATPHARDWLRGDAGTHFLSGGTSLVPTLKGLCSRFLKGSQFALREGYIDDDVSMDKFAGVRVPPPSNLYPDPMAFAEMMRQQDYGT